MNEILSNKDEGEKPETPESPTPETKPETPTVDEMPEEFRLLVEAMNKENIQMLEARDRLLNEVEDIKIRVAEELSAYKTLDRQYSSTLHTLAKVREALLSGRVAGDEIFDRWAEKCAEVPGHIAGLANDVVRELAALKQQTEVKLDEPSSETKSDDVHGAEMFSSLSTDVEPEAPKEGEPERALVAFSADTDDALIICSSGSIIEDHIERIATSNADTIGLIGHGNDPLQHEMWGLFVWEGVPEKAEDGSLSYEKGKWRDPDKNEWINILDGEEPWPSALEPSDEETE